MSTIVLEALHGKFDIKRHSRSIPLIFIIWYTETIDSRPPESAIKVEPDTLEVVASFYYLSDMLSVDRGCEVAVSTHDQTGCKNFRELLSVITSHHLS